MNRGTVSDLAGSFLLDKVEVGRYNLQVSFLGYETLVIPELLVGSGKEVVLDIAMDQKVTDLHEVVVHGKEIQPGNPRNRG
jgi:hypothetical protein